jgi:hypothetical protein
MVFKMSFAVNFVTHIYFRAVHHAVFAANVSFVGGLLLLRGCQPIGKAYGADSDFRHCYSDRGRVRLGEQVAWNTLRTTSVSAQRPPLEMANVSFLIQDRQSPIPATSTHSVV